MTSTNKETQNRYPSHTSLPKRPPYKFLTQNLTVTNPSISLLMRVCTKRVYLRRFIDNRESSHGSQERIYRPLKKNKLFKALKNVRFYSLDHSYALESLKTSKLLRNICMNSSHEKVAICLKRLPNPVLHIRLHMETHPQVIYKIPKYIERLSNLQSFVRGSYENIETGGDKDHVSKELKLYNKLALRRRKLKEIVYSLGRNKESSFQRAIKTGTKNTGITGLEFTMGTDDFAEHEHFMGYYGPQKKRNRPEHLFESADRWGFSSDIYQGVLDRMERGEEEGDPESFTESFHSYDPEGPNPYDHFDPHDDCPYYDDEDEDDYDDEDDEDGGERLEKESIDDPPHWDQWDWDYVCDGEFRILCRMREEMKPLFRYDLFPNLKKLSFSQESCTYPLGNFVGEGFKALKKLEELKIDMKERPYGTNYLFKGLIELPLLKRFSLNINFLKVDDWDSLEQFLKGQKKLESFSIELGRDITTKNEYERHNNHLQNLIQCLNKKPHFKIFGAHV